MSSLAALVVALAFANSFASAVPNVTVVPATGGCSAYPQYDATTGVAGPWTFTVDQSNSPVEGFGETCQIRYVQGVVGVQQGRITIVDNNQLAKNPLRCSNNSLQAWTPSGVSGYSWNPVNLTPFPYDAEIVWGIEGPAIFPYHHYVDGVKQPGVFLGSGNATKWGVQRVAEGGPPTGLPYWNLRLLGKNSALPWNGSATYPDEYDAFIKVYGS